MLTTDYRGSNSGRGPSPAIWADCDVLEIIRNPGTGYHFFDDFLNPPTFASATSQSGYITYQDTGVTIKGLATEVGGVLQIAGADADNDEGSITTGANIAGMVKIASASGKKLWFEARVRFPVITDWAMFIGLAEEGLAAADTLTDDTGATASKDLVGFRILTADPDGVDAIHRKAGQAEVVVLEEAQVAVAATWYKFGFKYEPNAGGTNGTLRYFVDGVEVANITDVSITTFPDGEELALLLAIKTGAAVEKKYDMDWWRVAMLAA